MVTWLIVVAIIDNINAPALHVQAATGLLAIIVAVLAGVLLATATLAVTVSAAADLSPPDAPAWLARWLVLLAALDWRAVCGLGGAVAAWLQVAAYRRYHRPPTRLALLPFDCRLPFPRQGRAP